MLSLAVAPLVRAGSVADPLEILPLNIGSGGANGGGANVGPLYPLVAPVFHSDPSASAKLYLDFTGDVNQSWGFYSPGTTPAYDIDNDTSTFSQAELNNIKETWMRVSEKYSPFNIDVTTEDPGNLNDKQTLKVVIGGDGSNGRVDQFGNPIYWPGGLYGGISYVGSFASSDPNIAYVFSNNLAIANHGVPKYVAEAASHEAGHAFGLVHQSDYDANGNKINEYSYGTFNFDPNIKPQLVQPGSKSPILGNSYYADRGLWWSGTSSNSPYIIQNDLDILSSATNGFGYRTDGPNNSFATATPLTIDGSGFYSASGIIETMTDKDYFSFTAPGGLVSFLVNVAPYGAMLDATASLYDSNGNLIAQSATSSLSELVFANVAPGTYDLVVSGAGNYGDIGQYFVTGSLGSLVPEPAGVAVIFAALVFRRRRHAAV